MKVLIATIAWMLCTILVILPTLAKPPPPPPPKPVEYTKLTWRLDYNKKTYTDFINSVRNAYKFGTVCKTPVTPKSANGKDEFILVDVINTSGKTITLAFQTTNLYFFGYMDTFKKKDGKTYTRANFVSTEFERLKKSDLFKAAGIKKKLPFGESYTDLQRVAGPRKDLPLGIVAISSNIDAIYGKEYKGEEAAGNGNYNKPKAEEIGKSMAKFALMAIQMIAEATRFKYIEGMVESKGIVAVPGTAGSEGTFKPGDDKDNTFILLQTNWDSISALIKKSSPGCEPVKSPAFPKWDDINKQMGLLNHVGNGLDDNDDDVPFMEGIFGNNDVALEFIM